MYDWTNRKVFGIHLSRFGGSWLNAGGDWRDEEGFKEWMRSVPFEAKDGTIQHISDDDVHDAYEMMRGGKFELENSIREYFKTRTVNADKEEAYGLMLEFDDDVRLMEKNLSGVDKATMTHKEEMGLEQYRGFLCQLRKCFSRIDKSWKVKL